MRAITNQVHLIGNLGTDPEIKQSANKVKTARLRLATNEPYRAATGENLVKTHWHNLVARGAHADMAEKCLSKGLEIAIAGKLVHTRYTDGDGQKRHFTMVEITDLQVLGQRA
jgi:single-strand DNA-binding protein